MATIVAGVDRYPESQMYRDLMRFKPDSLTPNAWAVQAGVSRTVWNDMRRHGNPSRRTLEKLLGVIGSSVAEFEALRLGPEPRPLVAGEGRANVGDMRPGWIGAPLQPLPLINSALAGEWRHGEAQLELTELRSRELVDRLPRPPSLASDPDAYAFTVVGASMWPRFRPGARVAVSPRSAVAVGDDVVARLQDANRHEEGAERVLVTHFVKRSADMFEMRQFNPDQTALVPVAQFQAVLKIVGELI